MGCETLLDLALKGLQQEKVGQKLGLGKGRDLQGPLQPPPSAPHLIGPSAASDLLAAGAPIAAAPVGYF